MDSEPYSFIPYHACMNTCRIGITDICHAASFPQRPVHNHLSSEVCSKTIRLPVKSVSLDPSLLLKPGYP